MWQNPKLVMQSTAKCLLNPPTPAVLPPTQQIQSLSSKLSRREFANLTRASLILLGSQALQQQILLLPIARAEENPPNTEGQDGNSGCIDKMVTRRAFFDVSVNGEPIGTIIIGLYGDIAPNAVSRFSDIISGKAGISYRRKEFVKIMPNYVQHGGVRSFGVDAELAKQTGSNLAVERLVGELEKANGRCSGTKNVAGSVGIVVRDPLKPPPKAKLVARKGKLEIDEEEVGKDPNGTEFVISTKESPELDSSTVVVGKVLEGMEVVEKIGQVKTVQDNTSSPYFRVAKLVGDKRAFVAERGFNRPYSKVLVTNCGLLD